MGLRLISAGRSTWLLKFSGRLGSIQSEYGGGVAVGVAGGCVGVAVQAIGWYGVGDGVPSTGGSREVEVTWGGLVQAVNPRRMVAVQSSRTRGMGLPLSGCLATNGLPFLQFAGIEHH
jgi:hypothetical protein